MGRALHGGGVSVAPALVQRLERHATQLQQIDQCARPGPALRRWRKHVRLASEQLGRRAVPKDAVGGRSKLKKVPNFKHHALTVTRTSNIQYPTPKGTAGFRAPH